MIAYVGQLIVDSVVAAINSPTPDIRQVVFFVLFEALLLIFVSAGQRGISACQALLRALLGQRVNVLILEKALTLQLSHFEDSEIYNKLTQARREASRRPLSLVNRTFSLVQNSISLSSYAVLLFVFSPWAVAILVAAGIPLFLAEAKFSGDAYRLFRWRSPDTRMQNYLESVIAREDGVKEVKVFRLGSRLLDRYRQIFDKLYKEDRSLTLRRDLWRFLLGIVSTMAFYGTYIWIAVSTVAGQITLGAMTMYLMLFRQGQTAVANILASISGMYEDNLYLSSLYEFLGQPVSRSEGVKVSGAEPSRGIEFENVSFSYPGATKPAIANVSFQVKPGESLAIVGENGSGKTTLLKMLTRLYDPTHGRVILDGVDLRDWNIDALRRRISVVFQDFGRYQFSAGENIGVGDTERFSDVSAWERAAQKGMAAEFIVELPRGYQTQLGRWFEDGQELSGGEWQKMALSRAFMRSDADILVLDEPTSSMDATSEVALFDHVRRSSTDKMTILISHRFSTVRAANQIIVVENGQMLECGSHEELLALGGKYATLFKLQAKGYE